MNFKIFIFFLVFSFLNGCGVKAKPDSFKNEAIPSYIDSFTEDIEYELAKPKLKN